MSDFEVTDHEVMVLMVETGGHFVSALGKAAMYADKENLEKLKMAFPKEWTSYKKRAMSIKKEKLERKLEQ